MYRMLTLMLSIAACTEAGGTPIDNSVWVHGDLAVPQYTGRTGCGTLWNEGELMFSDDMQTMYDPGFGREFTFGIQQDHVAYWFDDGVDFMAYAFVGETPLESTQVGVLHGSRYFDCLDDSIQPVERSW